MLREVIYAKLHGTDAFIPGVGGLGTTLPPTQKSYALKMYRNYEDGGDLLIEINGKTAAIPEANLQVVLYAPVSKPSIVLKSVNNA